MASLGLWATSQRKIIQSNVPPRLSVTLIPGMACSAIRRHIAIPPGVREDCSRVPGHQLIALKHASVAHGYWLLRHLALTSRHASLQLLDGTRAYHL